MRRENPHFKVEQSANYAIKHFFLSNLENSPKAVIYPTKIVRKARLKNEYEKMSSIIFQNRPNFYWVGWSSFLPGEVLKPSWWNQTPRLHVS